MKTYDFEVNLNIAVCNIEARNKREAREQLKEQFFEDYNLELNDKEIKEIK
jgi:hypothetical protein